MKSIEFQTVVYPMRGDTVTAADAAWAQISVSEKITTIAIHQYVIKIRTNDFYRALSRDLKHEQDLYLDILDYNKIAEPDVKLTMLSGKSKRQIITDKSKKLWPVRAFAMPDQMSVMFPRRDKNIFVLSLKKCPQKFEFRDKRIFIRIMHDFQK